MGLQLGEGLLDRVHVGAVGRQIAQFGAGGLDEFFDSRPFMGGQIVHDDDIARRERWDETCFHPFLEESGVDRPIEDLLRFKPAQAQAGDKRDRLVMAVRNGGAQPSSPPATSAFAREIGGGAGLVNENELPGIEIGLARKPCEAAASARPGAVARRRARSFFERHAVTRKEAPQHGARNARRNS